MTTAQDVMLLLLDEDTGVPLASGIPVKYALAGAVLMELQLSGRVTARQSDGRLAVASEDRAGDPVLDWALGLLAQDKARGPRTQVTRLGSEVRDVVVDQLVDAAVLQRDQGRITGWAPRDTWDAQVRDRHAELRKQLAGTVAAGDAGSQLDLSQCIALIDAAGVLPQVAGLTPDSTAATAFAASAVSGTWVTDGVRQILAAVRECVAAPV